ncbi:MAG: DUF3016 domain-containing protein [Rubrivivax sp.]|jgi:hypothetical protein|nr:DUF3016 domain-containing protein [Rubrivivax sp.]
MRTPIATMTIALALGASGGARAGTLDLSFVEPAAFADAGETAPDRERTQGVLGAHLQSLAARLPASQTLRLEVLDVDLAGRIERLAPRDVRVLDGGADWPRMHLRWTLVEAGRTVRQGDDRIDDMNYAQGLQRIGATDAYYFEKRLLDRWFQERFGIAPH